MSTREPAPQPAMRRLAVLALRFLTAAQARNGAYRNRMDATGRWTDEPTVEDCWGRSIWGLGTAVACSDDRTVRQAALQQFECAAEQRSPWQRAMAFAAVGATEVLSVHPAHRAALQLLADYAGGVAEPNTNPAWPRNAAAGPEFVDAAGHRRDVGRSRVAQSCWRSRVR